MRALIIISASLAMVIEPSSTWLTNSFTRSLPRSLASPNRPCSTIWSSKLASWASTVAAAAAAFATASGIGTSRADLALQLVQLFGIAHGLEKELFEFFVSFPGNAENRKTGSENEPFLEKLPPLGDIGRFKVVEFAELQIDLQ